MITFPICTTSYSWKDVHKSFLRYSVTFANSSIVSVWNCYAHPDNKCFVATDSFFIQLSLWSVTCNITRAYLHVPLEQSLMRVTDRTVFHSFPRFNSHLNFTIKDKDLLLSLVTHINRQVYSSNVLSFALIDLTSNVLNFIGYCLRFRALTL